MAKRVIQGDLCVLVGSKAISLSCGNSSLVVESLRGAGSELVAGEDPVEKLALMLAQGLCKAFEGLEARTHCHRGPAFEEATSVAGGAIGPEVLELLLEEVGADGTEVDLDEFFEPTALIAGEVLRSLEKEPSSLGEHGMPARCAKRPDLLPTSLVDGLAHEVHHVKAVEHVKDKRAAFANDLTKGSPHITRDKGEPFGSFGTEHVEEGPEAAGLAIASNVQETTASMIDLVDEGKVLVLLLLRELVDADGSDAIEVAMHEPPADSVLDAAEDGVPTRTETARNFGPRQDARPARNEPCERVG